MSFNFRRRSAPKAEKIQQEPTLNFNYTDGDAENNYQHPAPSLNNLNHQSLDHINHFVTRQDLMDHAQQINQQPPQPFNTYAPHNAPHNEFAPNDYAQSYQNQAYHVVEEGGFNNYNSNHPTSTYSQNLNHQKPNFENDYAATSPFAAHSMANANQLQYAHEFRPEPQLPQQFTQYAQHNVPQPNIYNNGLPNNINPYAQGGLHRQQQHLQQQQQFPQQQHQQQPQFNNAPANLSAGANFKANHYNEAAAPPTNFYNEPTSNSHQKYQSKNAQTYGNLEEPGFNAYKQWQNQSANKHFGHAQQASLSNNDHHNYSNHPSNNIENFQQPNRANSPNLNWAKASPNQMPGNFTNEPYEPVNSAITAPFLGYNPNRYPNDANQHHSASATHNFQYGTDEYQNNLRANELPNPENFKIKWRQLFFKTIILLGALGLLIGIGWLSFKWAAASSSNEVPLITNEDKPYKIRPSDKGGLNIPYQDKLIYDRISHANDEASANDNQATQLMQPPESPNLSLNNDGINNDGNNGDVGINNGGGINNDNLPENGINNDGETGVHNSKADYQHLRTNLAAKKAVNNGLNHGGSLNKVEPKNQQFNKKNKTDVNKNANFNTKAEDHFLELPAAKNTNAKDKNVNFNKKNNAKLKELPEKQKPKSNNFNIDEMLDSEPAVIPNFDRTPLVEHKYFIQLATVKSEEKALREWKRFKTNHSELKKAKSEIREYENSEGLTIYRLLVGPYLDKARALKMASRIDGSKLIQMTE